MTANTKPIWSKLPHVEWATITAANTATDGTGTVSTVFTADSTNGSHIDGVVIQPLGTNVATVIRFFVNNGQTNTTAANNTLVAESTLASTTGSNTTGIASTSIAQNWSLPPGYRILATIGTAVSAGLAVTIYGGDY